MYVLLLANRYVKLLNSAQHSDVTNKYRRREYAVEYKSMSCSKKTAILKYNMRSHMRGKGIP